MAKNSSSWKKHERATAAALGGKRNSRGADFSRSTSDVEHPIFSIECKYRKAMPALIRDGITQARSYDDSKIPLLVLKEHYQRGALVVLRLKDFQDLYGRISLNKEEE